MVGENEKKATRNMMKSKLLQIVSKYLPVATFYSTNKWNFACLLCWRAKKKSNRIRKKDSTKQLIFPSNFFSLSSPLRLFFLLCLSLSKSLFLFFHFFAAHRRRWNSVCYQIKAIRINLFCIRSVFDGAFHFVDTKENPSYIGKTNVNSVQFTLAELSHRIWF